MHSAKAIFNGLGVSEMAALRSHAIARNATTRPRRPRISLIDRNAFMHITRRSFITEALPSVLVPPFVFTSLLLGLWTYKCMMTVLLQDRIIYMPYMPPFARGEQLSDYLSVCKPVEWQQTHIESLDGTKIALCIGNIPDHEEYETRHVVICYFQGNGSSSPPRLPLLSNVLKHIKSQSAVSSLPTRYTLIALSYRGYWTSSGRASQKGIELDAQAMLKWVRATYGIETQLVLWGQSIGAGVAATAAATHVLNQDQLRTPEIAGLILETPFSGIKSMLLALYPQRWLPYRYLWPFLWNHWDAEAALRSIKRSGQDPKILLLPATRDEVVPPEEADKLENLCRELDFPMKRKNIIGALHTEATTRRDGQEAVAKFILENVR